MTSRSYQIPLTALIFLLSSFGCTNESKVSGKSGSGSNQPLTQTLTVFAAASLTNAFTEMEEGFERINPGVDLVLNLAGSQQLASQLRLGAPADVFASANPDQMQLVIDAGRIAADGYNIFARNQLIIIVPKDNPAAIVTLNDLSRPGIKLVLAAKEVPAGKYTIQLLDTASRKEFYGDAFAQSVLDHTVSFEQNVRAVRTKVALGEADAGIVYVSDVYKGEGSTAKDLSLDTVDIPATLNLIAHYPIAPLLNSPNQALAYTFIRYVLSEKGQQILTRHGFISL